MDRAKQLRDTAILESNYLRSINVVPGMKFGDAEVDKWCSPCKELGLGADGPTIPQGFRHAFLEGKDGRTVSFCLDCFIRIFGEGLDR